MKKLLTDLSPGENARVIRVKGNGAVRRRLIDMGIIPGTEIIMERYAPMGDPIEIKLTGCHLSLRKEEAATIEIEKIGCV